jgi:phage gp37-like protein
MIYKDKKGDLIQIIFTVVLGTAIFLILSPVFGTVISEVSTMPYIADNTGLAIFVASIPFVAFLGIIVWVYRQFAGASQVGGE